MLNKNFASDKILLKKENVDEAVTGYEYNLSFMMRSKTIARNVPKYVTTFLDEEIWQTMNRADNRNI